MKKFVKKALSIALALVMCVGMVAPAFAASFADLQDAINGTVAAEGAENHANGTKISKDDEPARYGYGWSQKDGEEEGRWGIEAWDVTDKDGKTNRNVQLNEDVRHPNNAESPLNISEEKEVTLDLNGNTIYSGPGHFTLQNSTINVNDGASLTLTDTKGTGAIDGEKKSSYAGAIVVDGGTFTMENGKITGFNGGTAGVNVKNGGTFIMKSGEISDNLRTGVTVTGNGSSFTMQGGKIFENSGGGKPGGVFVEDGATFTMNGGDIISNRSNNYGAGVEVNNASFTMTCGNITDNFASGIFMHNGSNVNLTAGEGKKINISRNTSKNHGAGILNAGGTLTLDGVVMEENNAGTMGGAIHGGNATIKNSVFRNNTANQNGDTITASGSVSIEKSTIENTEKKGYASVCAASGTNVILTNVTTVGDVKFQSYGKGSSITTELEVDRAFDFAVNADSAIKFQDSSFVVEKGKDGSITITDIGGNSFTAIVDAHGTRIEAGQLEEAFVATLYAPFSCAHGGSTETTQENEVAAQPGVNGSYEEVVHCSECGKEISRTTVIIPALPISEDSTATDDAAENPDETEIADPAVPLAAGPVTRAEFIDYLWRHEGEPASDGVCTFTDVPEDHTYVLALAWAEQNEVASAYDGGAFEPDELVTVSAVREFLGNFETVFGRQAVAASALTTLTGADDEAVLNCDEVLAEFFGA